MNLTILRGYYFYMRFISQNLVRVSVSDKRVTKALSLAFAVKALYVSSALNNGSYSNIARIFHIGRESAKERVQTLQSLGLIRRDGNRIIFLSFRQRGEGIKNVPILDYADIDLTNLKQVEYYLRLQGVYIKQSQIDYAANVQKRITNHSSVNELRRARRKVKNMAHWSGEADTGQAICTVMRSSGLKRNSAIRLLKWGESMRLLEKEKRFSQFFAAFGSDPADIFGKRTRGKFFVWHGLAFFVQPSILHFRKEAA